MIANEPMGYSIDDPPCVASLLCRVVHFDENSCLLIQGVRKVTVHFNVSFESCDNDIHLVYFK